MIRLAELLHGLDFRAALATLGEAGEEKEETHIWSDACDFYQHRLRCSPDAQCYLRSRGIESLEVIERMRMGYAPGGCLRAYLEDLGHWRRAIAASGLTDAQGRDRLWNAIVFPIEETAGMHGRQLDPMAGRHYHPRFPPLRHQLQVRQGTGEVRRAPSGRHFFKGLAPGVINLMLTDVISGGVGSRQGIGGCDDAV